mgnify:CR=1 FL=1
MHVLAVDGSSCFFLFVVAAALLGAFLWTQKRNDATRSAWSIAAGKLALTFDPGSSVVPPKLSGRVRGHQVQVEIVTRGASRSRRTYTSFRVLGTGVPAGVRVTRRSIVTTGLRRLFGGRDVTTGERDFDDVAALEADDAGVAQRYLTPERRRALANVLARYENVLVDTSQIRAEVHGYCTGERDIERAVLELLECADALARSAGRRPQTSAAPPAPAVTLDAARAAAAEAIAGIARARDPDALHFEDDPPLPPLRAALEPPVDDAPPPEPPATLLPSPPATTARTELPPLGSVPARPDPAQHAGSRQLDVCRALFEGEQALTRAQHVFAEEYESLFVTWTGTLERVQSYHSDAVFGAAPGVRAELDVARVSAGPFGERRVLAIVQFAAEARAALEARVGTSVTFEGDLLRIDPFMRHVFVARGRLVA